MSEMIERVARAILKVRFYDPEPQMYSGLDNFFSDIDEEHLTAARDEARAALEAMKETTGLMRTAGSDAARPHTSYFDNPTSSLVFVAMIDAALKETV